LTFAADADRPAPVDIERVYEAKFPAGRVWRLAAARAGTHDRATHVHAED
jgi:hypothetical protein